MSDSLVSALAGAKIPSKPKPPKGLMGMFSRTPVPDAWAQSPSYINANPQGAIQSGNINLFKRPNVHNPDGSVSTVRSMSYGDDTGETLIPTVSDEGNIMPAGDAIRYWQAKGQNLGKFATPDDADAYAEALHQQQASFYGLR